MRTQHRLLASLLGFGTAFLALAGTHASAQSYNITFDEGVVASGATLSNQFAAWGVTFAPGTPFGGSGPNGSYATNTDMGITATDVGGGTDPTHGNLLHTFGGWLGENGDPVFTMTFARPITSITVQFNGVATPSSSTLRAYSGTSLVNSKAVTTTGFSDVSLTGLSGVTRVVVTPGDFFDWVGIDNIRYNITPAGPSVPEPGSLAMLAGMGVTGTGLLLRRRRS